MSIKKQFNNAGLLIIGICIFFAGCGGKNDGEGSQGAGYNVDDISVEIADAEIHNQESTTLILRFIDSMGSAVPVLGEWRLSSRCIESDDSDVQLAAIHSDHVQYTYSSSGCVGDDQISVTGKYLGKEYSKSVLVSVSKPQSVSLTHLDTVPTQIFLKAGLGSEFAVVRFKVRGMDALDGLPGQTIEFRLEGTVDAATLVNTVDITDDQGIVEAQVASQSIPGNVTVIARHPETGYEAPSQGISITSSLASSGQFVIATNKFNVAAWNKFETPEAAVFVSASDAFGNAVADGTTVYFISQEGGVIDSDCKLQQGFCTVNWRPNGVQPANGRIQIFATIKGQEKYLDQNGNSQFDSEDYFYPFDPEFDLAEPYSDNNNNGMYDMGEHFVDSNGDAMWSPANGLWNGLGCRDTERCANALVDLGAQTTLIIAKESTPTICEYGEFDQFPVNIRPGTSFSLSGLYLSDGNSNAINAENSVCSVGNPPPAGSMIRFSASAGELIGPTEFEVNSNQIRPLGPLGITYKAPETKGPQQIELSITLSNGEVVSWVWPINVVGPLSGI